LNLKVVEVLVPSMAAVSASIGISAEYVGKVAVSKGKEVSALAIQAAAGNFPQPPPYFPFLLFNVRVGDSTGMCGENKGGASFVCWDRHYCLGSGSARPKSVQRTRATRLSGL
jgi:hypothetical protein